MRYVVPLFIVALLPFLQAEEKAAPSAPPISTAPAAAKPGDPPKPVKPDDGKGSKDNPDVLDPLTVSATATKAPPPVPQSTPPTPPPQPLESSRREIRNTAGGATVVKVDELLKGRVETFQDIFKSTPGVFVESNNGGQDQKISIRGSGIQGDTITGIEFLMDGIPFNQADGDTILEDFDPLSIKGAEVYRGGNAFRYGSMTLGGAINLISRIGYDASKLETHFEGGSWGYVQEGISTGGVKGPWDYYIAENFVHSDGYRHHSAEDTERLFSNIGCKLDCGLTNRIYLLLGRLDRDVPDSLTKEQMQANPRRAGEDAFAQNFHNNFVTERIMDKLSAEFDNCEFSTSLYYQHRVVTEQNFYAPDEREGIIRFPSNDFGTTQNFVDNNDLFDHKSRFTLGSISSFQLEQDTSYENLDGKQGPLINQAWTTSINVALYLEEQFYLTDKLSLTGGFQTSFAGRHFDDLRRPDGVPNQSQHQDFYALNPKFGALYDFDSKTQIFTNYTRTFQPPSFDDVAAVAEGSADGVHYTHLRAQRGDTAEVGARGEYERIKWEADFYNTWLNHELLALKNAQGQSAGTINAHSTTHRGVEAGVDADLFRGVWKCAPDKDDRDKITLNTSYTWNNFNFNNDPNFHNNRIAGIPVHLLHAELQYEHPCGFYAGPNVEWNVTKYPVDHANSLYADAYALLGFKMGYKMKNGLSVFIDARNLTNKTYAATVGAQSDARGNSPDAFNPGNGRSFYSGLSFKW